MECLCVRHMETYEHCMEYQEYCHLLGGMNMRMVTYGGSGGGRERQKTRRMRSCGGSRSER